MPRTSVAKIRKARMRDSGALARIQVDSDRTSYAGIFPPQTYLGHFSYGEQEQDWCDLLSSGSEVMLYVAETEAGEIVGYALGKPGPSDIPPYNGELVALHVRPAEQGQGIGRQLMAAVAGALQGTGCTALMLWVLEENPARALYERLGARVVGEKDWGGNQAVGIQKKEVAYGWPDVEALTTPDRM